MADVCAAMLFCCIDLHGKDPPVVWGCYTLLKIKNGTSTTCLVQMATIAIGFVALELCPENIRVFLLVVEDIAAVEPNGYRGFMLAIMIVALGIKVVRINGAHVKQLDKLINRVDIGYHVFILDFFLCHHMTVMFALLASVFSVAITMRK